MLPLVDKSILKGGGMIIDIHAHHYIEDMPCRTFQEHFVKFMANVSRRTEEEMWKLIPEYYDPSGEKLIRAMAEAGIDKTVISVLDIGLLKGIGDGKYSIVEQNKMYADLVKKYPDRLIAFAGIDPRRGDAIKILETAVEEWGMKGCKMITWTGYYPNDKGFYPFYEKAQELRIPLLFHTGTETTPAYSKYCHPVFLDEVANDFPGINIIMAHCGSCWWPEGAELASYKPNLFVDLATWQNKTRRWPIEEFYKPLRHIINIAGRHKVMFGTDWPIMKLYLSQADWVKKFTEIPEEVRQAGIEFTENEINGILGGNAARVLGLED